MWKLPQKEPGSRGPNRENSLLFSLLAGNSLRERLAPDCALRHAVCITEKFRPLCAKIRETCPHFAIIPRQTGLRRTHCSTVKGLLPRPFSGAHIRSPVSRSAQGEGNASPVFVIRNRGALVFVELRTYDSSANRALKAVPARLRRDTGGAIDPRRSAFVKGFCISRRSLPSMICFPAITPYVRGRSIAASAS
jgi:hypothetical protein